MSWEVRTMRSAKWYFNGTLFRKNFARFWPIWGLWGFLWLVMLPMSILLDGGWNWSEGQARLLPLGYLGNTSIALMLAGAFGLLAAMAVFSYLYNHRSVALMHSLPTRREGLFLTNYLSGLCFFLFPNIVVFLLALGAEALNGKVVFSSLFTWLVVTSLYCLFFYSFAVFCGMFTGHILALPAFYLILNVLAYAIAILLEGLAREFLFGFTSAEWLLRIATWFTPALALSNDVALVWPERSTEFVYLTGLGTVFLYALVGLVLTGLALAVYRRRQLERAGDVVSVGWVRPVFQFGVAFCTAITLGRLFYNLLYPLLPRGAWSLLICMLVWGTVGCFLARMLLQKTFWVFKGGWKGCAVFLCCLVAATCVLEFDLWGFEGKVPASSQVSRAFVDVSSYPEDDMHYPSFVLEQPEELEALAAFHQSVVDRKAAIEAEESPYIWEEDPVIGQTVETGTELSVRITYYLDSGAMVARHYELPVYEADLSDPTSPTALLTALINQPGLAERTYFRSMPEEGAKLVSAKVINLYDHEEFALFDEPLRSSSLEPLLTAVRADLADGGLGVRYLLNDRARLEGCYYADLELAFLVETDAGTDAFTITITLQPGAERTLAVLEADGVDLSGLITKAEEMAINTRNG